MKPKTKNILQTLIFVLLGLGCVWWFWTKLSQEEKSQMWNALSGTNYFWFGISALATLLSHYVRALRWRLLAETIGCNVSRKNSFLAVMAGYLTNLAVPRLGEVVRCTLLRRSDKVPIEKSLGTIITERATDMLLFLVLLILTLLLQAEVFWNYTHNNFNLDLSSLLRLAAIGLGLLVMALLAFFVIGKRLKANKIYQKIILLVKGLWEGVKSIFLLRKPLLYIAYSLFIWLLWIIGTMTCFHCLSQTADLGFVCAMVTTVLGAFGPMITPGGIGLQPAIYAEVLQAYAIARPFGYACGWLSWIISQIGTIVVGLYAFINFSLSKKSLNQ